FWFLWCSFRLSVLACSPAACNKTINLTALCCTSASKLWVRSMTMDKSAPRFQAGRISLPEDAGEITAMFSCDEVFEIYTENETYRVKSPEEVDPEITNP